MSLPTISIIDAASSVSDTIMPPCQLYVLTPPIIADLDQFVEALKAAMQGGPIAALQIRLKDETGRAAPDADICAVFDKVKPLCAASDTAIILNDRPDLAAQMEADGVHLGSEDMACSQARAMLGEAAIIGATCQNSRHAAFEAGEQGADYVAFGAFYPSQTKRVETGADLEILRWWSEIACLPCVAIGGITPKNAQAIIDAGADFLAVSSGVWNYPDGPQAAIRQFHLLCHSVKPESGDN